ncbi:hypothetical protein Cni_G07550 [Canna indica]|uniref:Uncharacterized protein n=1 Tax=Canna indica TaxID=4628 RepID=A0AAQ3JYY0_9LILI|nr:hypothetical protein Cni_G07550 [Canna indica]
MAATTEKSFHVRSVSWPSQAHPTTLRVEEELHKLRTCVATSACSITNEMICNGLKHLANLYEGIEDLLRLPSVQQGLLHLDQKRRLQEDVDGSLKLLDICGSVKDAVNTSKVHVQDLQLALRRRGENTTEEKIRAYIRSRKDMQKIIKKSCKDLKQVNDKCRSISLLEDSELSVISRVLNEARTIIRSLLCSILQSMSMPKTKSSWWSFSSKAMRMVCDDSCEAWNVDVSLCRDLKVADAEKVTMVQIQLKTIENSFGDLENGLECLFRRLIQNRVSLLNILSL